MKQHRQNHFTWSHLYWHEGRAIQFNRNAWALHIHSTDKTSSTNVPPVANAGQDIAINLPVNLATLTGSGTDPDGTTLLISGEKILGPTNGSITNTSAAATTVVGLSQGTYQFELKVTDNSGASISTPYRLLLRGNLSILLMVERRILFPAPFNWKIMTMADKTLLFILINTTENLGSFTALMNR